MRDRIVDTAIRLADTEGIAAVSMRRIGVELGVPTMSLYRWMPSKDDLTLHMLDATLGRIDWPEPPKGWRAQLEVVARAQWDITRRASVARAAPVDDAAAARAERDDAYRVVDAGAVRSRPIRR